MRNERFLETTRNQWQFRLLPIPASPCLIIQPTDAKTPELGPTLVNHVLLRFTASAAHDADPQAKQAIAINPNEYRLWTYGLILGDVY